MCACVCSALRDDAATAVSKLNGSKFQGGRTLRVAIARRRGPGSSDAATDGTHVPSPAPAATPGRKTEAGAASEAGDTATAKGGGTAPAQAQEAQEAQAARRQAEAEKLKTVMIWGLAADFPVARLRKR